MCPFSEKPVPVPAFSRHGNGIEGAARVLPEHPAGRALVGNYPWHEIDADDLAIGEVKAVVAGGHAVCLARTPNGLGALDNRCPHQGVLSVRDDRGQMADLSLAWLRVRPAHR